MKNSTGKVLVLLSSLLILLFVSVVRPAPARAQLPGALCALEEIQDLIAGFLDGLGLGFLTPEARPWYEQTVCDFLSRVHQDPDSEIFGERYTYAQVNWIINSLMGQVFPLNVLYSNDLFNELEEVLLSQKTPDLASYLKFGPAGLLLGVISQTTVQQPASGIAYFKNLASRFSLAPPASAQGYGYTAISGLQDLWTASRNLSYFILIIVMIAAGFMIIFRVKIGAQTAVTIQMLLPRIIITLLLITFSYAIAGFVIDLIYVIISIVVYAFLGAGTGSNTVINFISSGRALMWVNFFFMLMLIPLMAIPFLGGGLMAIIIGLVITFLLMKVAWMMLKTYVTFLALIVFGPWMIAFGLLSPRDSYLSAGFGSWLRNILAHASVFATVPIMFLFSIMLFMQPIWGIINTIVTVLGVSDTTWGEFVGSVTLFDSGSLPVLPFAPGVPNSFYAIILGFVVLAMIPKAAEMMRDFLKASKFGYGSAMGQALGPVVSVGRTAGGVAAPNVFSGIQTAYGGTTVGKAAEALNQYGQQRKWWGNTP